MPVIYERCICPQTWSSITPNLGCPIHGTSSSGTYYTVEDPNPYLGRHRK